MVSIYDDPRHYDALMGDYAGGAELQFYLHQAARAAGPVLELGCGTGRLTIPLAEDGVAITGIDLSEAMLALAERKARAAGVAIPWVRADFRDFQLLTRFALAFIPINTFAHLAAREDQEAFLACVRRHLTPEGKLLIAYFNPSLELLTRDPRRRYTVGEYYHPDGSGRVIVTESHRYDRASQINHLAWHYQQEGQPEQVRALPMRIFYPQELKSILYYNGFEVEAAYGDYDGAPFSGDASHQLLVCRPL